MARPRRTAAAAAQQATEAPTQAQPEAQETNQEAAEVQTAPESTQEPEVTTVAETPAETPAEPAAQAEAQTPAADAQAAAQTSDGQAAPAQADAKPAEEKKTPEEMYEAFKATVETAVTNGDETTGTPTVVDQQACLEAYRELPTTAKKAEAKAWMGAEMVSAMNDDLVPRARTFMEINKLVNEASARRATSTAAAKPSKSPTELYTEERLALELAWEFLPAPAELDNEKFQELYGGLKQEVGPQIEAYRAWLWNKDTENRGDEPEVSDVVKNAAKIASGKTTKRAARKSSGGGGSTAGGPRGDVAKHIAEFLDTINSGDEVPISVVAKFKSSQYPDGNASAGAISARVFKEGGTNIEGIEPLPEATPKKLRKL